ncbi:histone-lysine N-methyltransferase SETMAR-like [Cydia strobilella]|uniref:histone-lysine N-methyltransferase SETMAR-like n=1 Tax=Cydia strobilella TaxID=1100964 RepID=UPI00300688FF
MCTHKSRGGAGAGRREPRRAGAGAGPRSRRPAPLLDTTLDSVEDLGHDGRPVEVLTPENINSVQEKVLSDRRLKIREIAARLGLSKSTVHRIIHDHLHMSKSKRESMEWRFKNEKPPITEKVHQSTKKLMCTIFWDCHGILMVDFKERNTVINGAYYASLIHKLRAIKEKRRGKLAKGVLLLHDNAPVHTAFVAKAAVRECGFTEVDHPPYSPDMAPSDYFLFPNLKRDLRGKKFFNDEELEAAVLGHFEDKTSRYFYKGIQMLIQRCQKCVDIKGDYIEK